MILKAHERARGSELATYLLDRDDNDHVEVHEVRGFIACDVRGALEEGQAISRGSRCDHFLFSTSLNPPEDKRVTTDDYLSAAGRMEENLSLQGQPSILLFHERSARRHAHCVWSRIRPEPMTAINLSWFRYKLSALSRELYEHFGWPVPAGFLKRTDGDPLVFSREQFEQAKPFGKDPREIKGALLRAWQEGSTSAGFAAQLGRDGFLLCRGTKGGYVVIDRGGGVYGLSHWLPYPRDEVKARLGGLQDLPSIVEGRARFSAAVFARSGTGPAFEAGPHGKSDPAQTERRRKMVLRHRKEREALRAFHAKRMQDERKLRVAALPQGTRIAAARASGALARLRAQNERAFARALSRDSEEMQDLIDGQLAELRRLTRPRMSGRGTRRGCRAACEVGGTVLNAGIGAAASPPPTQMHRDEKPRSDKKNGGRKGGQGGGGSAGGFERRTRPRGVSISAFLKLWHKVRIELTLRPAERRKLRRENITAAPLPAAFPAPLVPTDRRVRRAFVPESRRG